MNFPKCLIRLLVLCAYTVSPSHIRTCLNTWQIKENRKIIQTIGSVIVTNTHIYVATRTPPGSSKYF